MSGNAGTASTSLSKFDPDCPLTASSGATGSPRYGEKRGKTARQRELAKRLVFGHFFLSRAFGCSPFMIDRISLKSYPFFESS